MNHESRRRTVHEAIARLQRLAELFHLRRGQLARGVGLTEAQWRVLEEIATDHFMPSMFARASESSPPAVSRLIRQLTDRGLISVSVSDGDARQRRYALTAAGRRLLARLRTARARAIDAVWMDLPATQLDRFVRFSDALIPRLEAYAESDSEET
jgi:DNA-binding MarR family transcriptional regulator